jgi:sporulation protein YlmC with PRC-barrel domain
LEEHDRGGDLMNTKDLFDKEVLDANAEKVGQVIDIDFDLRKAALNHLVVQTGVFKKQTIGIDKIDKIGDKLVLKITKHELKQ